MFIMGLEKIAISMKTYISATRKIAPQKAIDKINASSMKSAGKALEPGKTKTQIALAEKHQLWRNSALWERK